MSSSMILIIASCAVAVFSTLISIYSIIVSRRMKDYDNRKRTGQVPGVNYQRQSIEDQIYRLNNRMTSNPQSFIDLNHLLISRNDQGVVLKQSVADNSFFEERGIDFSKYKVDPNQITCLMPFNHKYDKIYKAISNAGQKCGYKVVRSDDHYISDDILKYTIELILKAQIVVIVIDGRNPNVFYEMGIAHALGKQTLLLASISSFQNAPFDIQNNRMVLYKGDVDLQSKLEVALRTLNH